MFDYAQIKADLEQIECPLHAKKATVIFENGRLIFENICCDAHRKKLEEAWPDIEKQNIADIVEEVY